jgi:hypothetical protein
MQVFDVLAGLEVLEPPAGLGPDHRVTVVEGDQYGGDGALVTRKRQQLDDQVPELGVSRGLLITLGKVRDGLAPVEENRVKCPV